MTSETVMRGHAGSGAEATEMRTWVSWWTPFLCAAGAVGLHVLINVPSELPPRKGAAPPAPPAAPPAPVVAGTGVAEGGPEALPYEPRTAALVRDHARRFHGTPFRSEPRQKPWALHHESLLTQVLASTRAAVFAQAPDAPVLEALEPKCRSVRCRVTLVSPHASELEHTLQALRSLELEGEPLFLEVEAERSAEPRPGAQAFEVYVVFRRDDLRATTLAAVTLEGRKLGEVTGSRIQGLAPEAASSAGSEEGDHEIESSSRTKRDPR